MVMELQGLRAQDLRRWLLVKALAASQAARSAGPWKSRRATPAEKASPTGEEVALNQRFPAAQAQHRSCSAGGRLPTAQAYAEAPGLAETDVSGDRSLAGAQVQIVGALPKNPTMSGVFC